jgi:MerR family transcriptional regulator, aldehyde-responsive regulator
MNITQVARKLNLTASTPRYYEQVGLIPSVSRRESGIRTYNEKDIK